MIAVFPFFERYAVDAFACLVVIKGDVSFPSGCEIPFGETVPAESSEIHEINILHVGAALQVFYQATKSGGFNFDTSLVIHEDPRWKFGSYCQIFGLHMLAQGFGAAPVTHAGMSTSVLSDQLGNKLEQSGNPLNVAVVFSPTGRRRNLWC